MVEAVVVIKEELMAMVVETRVVENFANVITTADRIISIIISGRSLGEQNGFKQQVMLILVLHLQLLSILQFLVPHLL